MEIFGNHEKQDPNTITNNNEFMKKIAYEKDLHVDNDELHAYEDSNVIALQIIRMKHAI